jgi:hypothetical protein
MIRKTSILFFFLIRLQSFGQFLDDTQNKEITSKGLDYLYNQQFELADKTFDPVKDRYANHPVKYLINALQIQWENIPIDKNPAALSKYIKELNNCITSAKVIYKQPTYKKEATFFLLAAYGFIALSHNYQKDFLAAANEAKKAHGYFIESKKYKNSNAEFLYASGLYNYYRIQYPESHPLVKPIVVFFENGNKPLGLSELESSFNNSIFSRNEAASILININLKYESNFKKSLTYSSILYNRYPNNFIFKIKHIECLLLSSELETAKTLNDHLLKTRKDKVSTVSGLVFDAYYNEHQTKNYQLALINYAKALKIPYDERYTKEYHGMAYLGMARIFVIQNNLVKAKAFYKECLKITEYNWRIKEAKKELKSIS